MTIIDITKPDTSQLRIMMLYTPHLHLRIAACKELVSRKNANRDDIKWIENNANDCDLAYDLWGIKASDIRSEATKRLSNMACVLTGQSPK